MAFFAYVASGKNIQDLIDAFSIVPFASATSTDSYGFNLIDIDFYRTPQAGVLGERLNVSMILQPGSNNIITPHYTLRVYKSDINGNAIAKFQNDQSIHDLFPYRIFDMTPIDPSNPEDQILGVIFRNANFEQFPTAASVQEKFNVSPQSSFPALTFAAEATGVVSNDGVAIPINGTGFAMLYDSNGQRVRDFTGFGLADTQVEGQVLIRNVHPTVTWPAGRRGLVTAAARFTEETAKGAPVLIGLPNCCP